MTFEEKYQRGNTNVKIPNIEIETFQDAHGKWFARCNDAFHGILVISNTKDEAVKNCKAFILWHWCADIVNNKEPDMNPDVQRIFKIVPTDR